MGHKDAACKKECLVNTNHGNQCSSISKNNYHCSRLPNHEGDHVACSNICAIDVWRNQKSKLKVVTLELRQSSDGHWLSFKNGAIESMINIENTFQCKGIIANNIVAWAKAQFKEKDND